MVQENNNLVIQNICGTGSTGFAALSRHSAGSTCAFWISINTIKKHINVLRTIFLSTERTIKIDNIHSKMVKTRIRIDSIQVLTVDKSIRHLSTIS